MEVRLCSRTSNNGLVWDREKWPLKKINAKDEKGWRDEQTASHSHVKFFFKYEYLGPRGW